MTLRQLRKSRGLTQSEAAELVGIVQPKWSDYERGKTVPPFRFVSAVLRAFYVNGIMASGQNEWMFTETEPTPPAAPSSPSA